MAITLDQAEIDDFLTNGHTVIFTTVDKDGFPHSTPLWYAYLDGHIYVRGRGKSQKARNIGRNPKVSCIVESGLRWRELKAVMVRGRAELLADEGEIQRFSEALTEKYRSFREASSNMPQRTQQHYSTSSVHYRIVPEKKVVTWDNGKIRLVAP